MIESFDRVGPSSALAQTGAVRLGRSPLFPAGQSPQSVSWKDRYLNLYREEFSDQQLVALRQWQTSLGVKLAPAPLVPVRESARPLYELFSRPADPETAEGRATFDALEQIGVLAGYPAAAIRLLVDRFSSSALSNADFFWHGHGTEAMLTLAPALEAMGVGRITYAVSGTTGQGPVVAALERQAQASEGKLQWLGYPPDMKMESGDGLPLRTQPNGWVGPPLAQLVLEAARAAQERGRVLIVDRLGPAIESNDPELLSLVNQGVIRPIAHNSDDVHQLESVAGQAWTADLHDSKLKAAEAAIVGQINAPLVEREVRAWPSNGRELSQTPAFVFGYGQIGRGLVLALSRLKTPPPSITVIDPLSSARGSAIRDGFQAIDSPDALGTRPAHAVALIATPVAAATPDSLPAIGDDVLIVSFSTGDKGVARQALREAGESRVVRRRPAKTDAFFRYTLPDEEFLLPSTAKGRAPMRATVIMGGRAPNLFEPQHQDRMTLLPMALALGAAVAAGLEGPGPCSFPEDIDEGLVALHKTHGLDRAVSNR